MSEIHNGGSNPHRMPVILNEKDEDKWLDPNTTQEELELLMQPYPDKLIDAYPIKYSPQKFRVASAFDADLVITK